MKKMLVWVMALALLLCAACGKTKDKPETPDLPEQPPQQEQPTQPSEPDNSPQTEPDNDVESLAGKVAVLTANAELQNASAETVDAEGNVILMDMAVTLEQGTLVYVESQEDTLCTVILLAGEPPHPKGQLNVDQLSAQTELLLQAQQVILNDTPSYAAAGGETLLEKRSGVAQVELRNALWWKVSLPGGGESFWIKETDLTWEWPLPDMPELPQPPAEPEAPKVVEPEGFVSASLLPGDIPGAQTVDGIIPLRDNAAAILAGDGEKTRIMLYDYTTSAVLAQKEVPVYGEINLTRMDGSTFYFADGQRGWQVAADGSLSMTEYTLQSRLWMGDKKVDNTDGSILVDGQVVLQGQPGGQTYLFLSAAGDQRLLYEVYDKRSGPQGNYGIYDHTTGEGRLVTTMGQRVLGVWNDTLVISRTINHNQKYELGVIDLNDYSYTALTIGHETVDRAVDEVMCNDAGTRLQVTWTDEAGTHVQIFDLETQKELYAWTAPAGESWSFFPEGDNALMVWTGESDNLTVWKVEY